MSPRLSTMHGLRRPAPPSPMRIVRLTSAEVRALASVIAGWSAQAEAEGHFATAERLAIRAAALKEASIDRRT